jgi:hypothetical protein
MLIFFWSINKHGRHRQFWAEHVSITFHSALRKLNTEPSIGVSHQILAHFCKAVSEKKIFRNWPISILVSYWSISKTAWPNDMKLVKKHLWKVLNSICSFRFDPLTNMAATDNSCFWLADLKKIFSSDRDKMSILYRALSIDASYQVSVYFDKQFQRRRFF